MDPSKIVQDLKVTKMNVSKAIDQRFLKILKTMISVARQRKLKARCQYLFMSYLEILF